MEFIDITKLPCKSSGRKWETGSDRYGAVLVRIRMRRLRLWSALRAAAYELHAPSGASDWSAPSFDRLLFA
jgi:hypothetical protein